MTCFMKGRCFLLNMSGLVQYERLLQRKAGTEMHNAPVGFFHNEAAASNKHLAEISSQP
jgi:hypothetical protein